MKLPQAAESELVVLGGILVDGDVLADISELLPHAKMFSLQKHQLLYEAMLGLYARNDPVTLDTIQVELDRRKTMATVSRVFLAELLDNTATAANAPYHAQIVAQKYTEREILLAAAEIQERITSGDTENIRDRACERIYDAGRVDPPTPTLWEQVSATLRLNEQGRKAGGVGYPWGLPALDRYSGGIRPGKTTVIAGLKKCGKSKFLMQGIAELLRQGVPVLFFSLEMRATAVLNWLASSCERIDSGKFETSRLTDDELERTARFLSTVAEQQRLVICDRSFLTIEQIRQEVRREVQRHEVRVVVIDFIQRINVEQQKGESRAGALQRAAYRLADLARDYNVGLVLAAQLSNEAEKTQSVHMGLIKESGGIAEAADVILLLDNKRRTQHKTSLDPTGQTEIDLLIEGQRNGVSGIRVPLQAQLQFGQFTEVSHSTQLAGSLTRKEVAYAQN